MRTFERFVAIGDSTAEGIGDPDPAGRPRGFADRLAGRLAAHQGAIAYANLAVSGYVARTIRDRQLAPALALRPDLAAIMAGMNDLLQARFDVAAIGADITAMQGALVATGCTVLAFTLPDVAHRLAVPPFDRLLSRRTRALNEAIRRASAASGALVIDLAGHPMATDPRMWTRDRLHGNSDGHERIAAACAQALALPGADSWWREPLPPFGRSRSARIADRVDWGVRYMLPWLRNRVRRPPELDRRVAKHCALVRMTAP